MSNVEQGAKQLKITIAVDNNALEQFKRAIREATAEVSKLVETLNKASGLLGGGGRGLMGGVSTKGGFNAQGGVGAQRTSGIGAGLTAPVEGVGAGIRNIARGSNDALRQMETSLRSSVGKQVQDMKLLERALDSVNSKYKNMRGGFGGGGGGVMTPGGGGWGFGGNPMPGAGSSFVGDGERVVMRGGVATVARQGAMSRAMSFMGRDVFGLFGGGGGGGEGGGGKDLSELEKLYKAARKALPAYMVVKGAQMFTSEMMSQGDDYNRQATALGGTYGQRALGMMRGKDFTTLWALNKVVGGEQREIYNKQQAVRSQNAEIAVRNQARVQSFASAPWYKQLGGMPSMEGYQKDPGARSAFGNDNSLQDWRGASAATRYTSSAIGSIFSGPSGIANMLRNFEGVDTEQKNRYLTKADEYLATHATDADVRGRQRFGAEWSGMIGSQRALGVGKGIWNLDASLSRRGYSLGDLAGAQSGVEGAGGFRTAQRFGQLALAGQTGHVGNLGQFIGMSAQTGANGGDMARYLAGGGGDPAAQATMASTLMAQMGSGSAMSGPGGLMGVLQAGGSIGGMGNSAEQMRVQAGMGQGVGLMNQNIFGGGLDNLQKGRNYVNAINSTGGNLAGSQWLAEHMNLGMIAELRSGKASPQVLAKLRSLGISTDQALQYGNKTMSTVFRNAGLMKGPAGDMARDMLKSGKGSDFGGYLASKRGTKGFNEKDALANFSSILQFEQGGSDQAMEGLARAFARGGKLKKGGFMDAAAGTTTAVAADEAGKAKQEEAHEINKMTPEEVRENVGKGARKIGDLGRNIGMSAEDVGKALENLAKRIDNITAGLKKAEDRVTHN